MNIGDAAQASGVSSKAIRYYENAGLIPPALRTAGATAPTRRPTSSCCALSSARDLGFSIERTRLPIDLWQDKGRASADVKRLALAHVAEIEAKITELMAMRNTVRELAFANWSSSAVRLPPREKSVRNGLAAGGRWIRTFG